MWEYCVHISSASHEDNVRGAWILKYPLVEVCYVLTKKELFGRIKVHEKLPNLKATSMVIEVHS